MSKNLLDNGTVLTLGLVGAVAAIGVAANHRLPIERKAEA